ncbi:MAG: response regulator transcription factor [Pseudomonadota bacterium]
MGARAIRVLLVDDHAIARGGVRLMLETCADFQVVGEADSAPAALSVLARTEVDVALVDIGLPGKNGLELLVQLRSEKPTLAVIMLSAHPEEMYGVRALKAGAAGYLTKDAPTPLLLAAVRRVAAGHKFIGAELAERLTLAVCGAGVADHELLSDREFDVMKRLASGESLVDIGQALFLSPKTITTYRTRVLEKMGFSCNAQLTRYALEQGLI